MHLVIGTNQTMGFRQDQNWDAFPSRAGQPRLDISLQFIGQYCQNSCQFPTFTDPSPYKAGLSIQFQWWFVVFFFSHNSELSLSICFSLSSHFLAQRTEVLFQFLCLIPACPTAHISAVYPEHESYNLLLYYRHTNGIIIIFKFLRQSNVSGTVHHRNSIRNALHRIFTCQN